MFSGASSRWSIIEPPLNFLVEEWVELSYRLDYLTTPVQHLQTSEYLRERQRGLDIGPGERVARDAGGVRQLQEFLGGQVVRSSGS